MLRKVEFAMNEVMKDFLSGKKLYGDDFTQDQLAVWCKIEKEGFGDLVRTRPIDYHNDYHELNKHHGFQQ